MTFFGVSNPHVIYGTLHIGPCGVGKHSSFDDAYPQSTIRDLAIDWSKVATVRCF